MCDMEFESTVNASERVISPGTESSYWIATALDPKPEKLFDSFTDQLQLLYGAKILGTHHHRKNAVRSFGIAARHRNHSGEKLEDIAPDYPKAASSRHAINAEQLLQLYACDLEYINAPTILDYLGGSQPPITEAEKRVRQLQSDCEETFRLMLDVATSRDGDFDPILEALNSQSPHRKEILKGNDCSIHSLNRIANYLNHIGIPEKRTQEVRNEK